MAKKLNIAPTKSNYLACSKQLDFARDGFELLEQKRQILVFELMSRLGQAKDIERRVSEKQKVAFESLRNAVLDIGGEGIDSITSGLVSVCDMGFEDGSIMGIRVPKLEIRRGAKKAVYGVASSSVETDRARDEFAALIPLIVELAEIENAVFRLAKELKKTQRRCNALSRVFIPQYEATTQYITSSLEERERENFVILRMVKERLAKEAEKEI